MQRRFQNFEYFFIHINNIFKLPKSFSDFQFLISPCCSFNMKKKLIASEKYIRIYIVHTNSFKSSHHCSIVGHICIKIGHQLKYNHEQENQICTYRHDTGNFVDPIHRYIYGPATERRRIKKFTYFEKKILLKFIEIVKNRQRSVNIFSTYLLIPVNSICVLRFCQTGSTNDID